MKKKSQKSIPLISELLILSDGRILVHQLTPTFAQLLECINAEDPGLKMRVQSAGKQFVPGNDKAGKEGDKI